jgi:hypothetical protein
MEMIFDELKTGQYIFDFLDANINEAIYFNRAPETATFPFGVFNFTSAFQGEDGRSNFMLEIDIWDNKGNNIIDLLTLQKDLQILLHKRHCKTDDLTLFFTLESTLQLNDQEEQIRRRQLRFNVRYNNRN